MKTLGYYNGKFGPLEEMTVPMNDRACYFGDGVYEATLARNGKIFALKEHLYRFFNSAGLLRIEIPYTREELTAILYDMLAKMDDSDIFIYWQMTRGTGIRQHQFPEKGVVLVLQHIVITDAGTDEHFFHAGDSAQFLQEFCVVRMIGIQIFTGCGRQAVLIAAKAMLFLHFT